MSFVRLFLEQEDRCTFVNKLPKRPNWIQMHCKTEFRLPRHSGLNLTFLSRKLVDSTMKQLLAELVFAMILTCFPLEKLYIIDKQSHCWWADIGKATLPINFPFIQRITPFGCNLRLNLFFNISVVKIYSFIGTTVFVAALR